MGAGSTLSAQDNFFARWEKRASQTQSKQPSWSVPLVSPYPMLIQVFRADFTRQVTPALTDTWNYGASRGLNLIPWFNSEFDFYYPPYIQHNVKTAKDGFGDVGFLYKYRILSRNENSYKNLGILFSVGTRMDPQPTPPPCRLFLKRRLLPLI